MGYELTPGSISVSSEQPAHAEAHFPLSHTNKPEMVFLRLHSVSFSYESSKLAFCRRKNHSRSVSAASITVHSVNCDEFLMCAEDIKKENTMHHNTINSAQNQWPAVLSAAGICVFIELWKRERLTPTLNDGSSCLALKKWHKDGD